MTRKTHRPPDGVLDVDRGTGSLNAKSAEITQPKIFDDRDANRAGLRHLDAMTERLDGLTTAQKNANRIFPRTATRDLGHPRMERRLPGPDTTRTPLSARQRNARSHAARPTQGTLPLAQLRAEYNLVRHPKTWTETNDALSDATGDIQELPPAMQTHVRRVDRAIQAYERRNDRGHLVYVNVELPGDVNIHNRDAFLDKELPAGKRIAFDRYTAATHQLHETAELSDRGTDVVFEMQTRRGAYLGRSSRLDATNHLLPRGLLFEVVGSSHTATYTRRDGSTGTRRVIQLRDITPTPERDTP